MQLVPLQVLIVGLAVLALATVPSQKTGASAQTAGFPTPILNLEVPLEIENASCTIDASSKGKSAKARATVSQRFTTSQQLIGLDRGFQVNLRFQRVGNEAHLFCFFEQPFGSLVIDASVNR